MRQEQINDSSLPSSLELQFMPYQTMINYTLEVSCDCLVGQDEEVALKKEEEEDENKVGKTALCFKLPVRVQ